jgi:hypothetical protein
MPRAEKFERGGKEEPEERMAIVIGTLRATRTRSRTLSPLGVHAQAVFTIPLCASHFLDELLLC